MLMPIASAPVAKVASDELMSLVIAVGAAKTYVMRGKLTACLTNLFLKRKTEVDTYGIHLDLRKRNDKMKKKRHQTETKQRRRKEVRRIKERNERARNEKRTRVNTVCSRPV
jgi:hypothetical protein